MSRKNLYIVGARGFGRELVGNFRLWNGFSDRYEIMGFLDDKGDALDGYDGYPPIVSGVEAFRPRADDVFVCALGAVTWRKKYIRMVLDKGGRFDTIVSPSATVHGSATVGAGCVILNNAIVSSDVSVGDNVLVHAGALLGHDTKIGDNVVIESFAFTGGFASVGDDATLHTRATVLSHKKVGAGATVGAGSTVITNVRPGKTVFGVPAIDISL